MPDDIDDQLSSLLAVVEELRSQKYESLEFRLLEGILRLHCNPLATDTELTRGVQELIDQEMER